MTRDFDTDVTATRVAGGAERHRIVIIGAGFAGLGAAHRLKQEGEHDFAILERADDVGGVWRENRYPGCVCDIKHMLQVIRLMKRRGRVLITRAARGTGAEIIAWVRC